MKSCFIKIKVNDDLIFHKGSHCFTKKVVGVISPIFSKSFPFLLLSGNRYFSKISCDYFTSIDRIEDFASSYIGGRCRVILLKSFFDEVKTSVCRWDTNYQKYLLQEIIKSTIPTRIENVA
jgi:hypothetical protein